MGIVGWVNVAYKLDSMWLVINPPNQLMNKNARINRNKLHLPTRSLTAAFALAATALLAAPAGALGASGIAWGTPTTATANTDVFTNGVFEYAYDWKNASTTVNTITFAGTASTTAGGGNVTLSGFASDYTGYGGRKVSE